MAKRPVILRSVLAWILLAGGTGILLFPSFSDAANEIWLDQRITAYTRSMEDLEAGLIRKELERAERYNQEIAAAQNAFPFSYRGAEASDAEYESLLQGPGGEMCILEVPSAGICLPVMHGTSEDVLTAGAGHMYGTSLPTGGPDTHCVIAGHTGLPTVKLFSDLRKAAAEDEVLLTVTGEKHRYLVKDILTVLPEEEARFLQVRKGEDWLTLYTCTPPGINDHRLLVQCIRVFPDAASPEAGEIRHYSEMSRTALARAILIAAVPVLIALTGFVRTVRAVRKNRQISFDAESIRKE